MFNKIGPSVATYSIENLAKENPQCTYILAGNCPSCRIGILESEYGMKANIMGRLLGIYGDQKYKTRVCPNCGDVFDYKEQLIKKGNEEDIKVSLSKNLQLITCRRSLLQDTFGKKTQNVFGASGLKLVALVF
ncbi:hypothetical protein WA026_014738 [Henosepilachna vigintioctopunctata]|uniref:Uncharacterized protein n=1 Tax=Henosepilachna vigintioctopunctata TaxID=420089 RepID=A0AAW1VEY3_9CUCU